MGFKFSEKSPKATHYKVAIRVSPSGTKNPKPLLSLFHIAPYSTVSAHTMSSGQGKKRLTNNSGEVGFLAKVTRRVSDTPIVAYTKQKASDAAYVSHKLLKSTGKAAWIAGTTFLILVVPLIIEMDREQQFNELEMQQQSLLGAPPLAPAQK